MSNDKPKLYEKIVSVELLVIVIIVIKRYPSTYCLMQGSCFICINLYICKKNVKLYLKLRITIFKLSVVCLYLNIQCSYLTFNVHKIILIH